MSRKLATCLLTSAALSIALFTPVAQAEVTFTMPAFASLEDQGTGAGRFVTNGIGIACDEAVYRGEASGNSRVLELEPEYAECTTEALTGFPADFFQELCDYVLHDAEPTEGGWEAEVDIHCNAEWDSVGWDIYETEDAYSEASQFCSTRVPEQPGVGTAELRNLAGRSGIEIRWNFSNFKYTVETPRSFGSSLLCGSMLGCVRRDAYYRGTTTVVARDSVGGRLLDLSLSD